MLKLTLLARRYIISEGAGTTTCEEEGDVDNYKDVLSVFIGERENMCKLTKVWKAVRGLFLMIVDSRLHPLELFPLSYCMWKIHVVRKGA